MRTPPNALVRATLRFFALPEPALEETYDAGMGTVLPSKVFRRWSIWAPTTAMFVFLGLLVGSAIASDLLTRPGEFDIPGWGYAAAAPVLIFLLAWGYVGAACSYYMLEYRFDDLGLHVRKGAGIVQEITLSYRNIQNVSIQRGPVDLLLGLSKVVVETAGGGGAVVVASNNASGEAAMAVMGHRGMMIGLDRFVAEDIRRDLIHRMNQFHGSGLGDHGERARGGDGGAPPSPVVPTPAFEAEHLDLLAGALGHLRRANAALGAGGASSAGTARA